MARRITCECGRLTAIRCRKTATHLVVWPTSPGGSYRCEAHAEALAALISAKSMGPVSKENIR